MYDLKKDIQNFVIYCQFYRHTMYNDKLIEVFIIQKKCTNEIRMCPCRILQMQLKDSSEI